MLLHSAILYMFIINKYFLINGFEYVLVMNINSINFICISQTPLT